MTPDAVIYRYLQVVAPTEFSADRLCALLSADADLLARWLKLLNLPADIDVLQNRIEQLDPDEFASLAEAQAWTVLPIVGSARLGMDQWLAVLRAACLAEVLAEHLSQEAGIPVRGGLHNVRLRALLAISGVQLAQDPLLTQLIEFRGTNPALLEDAAAELRVFAVIDAMEVGRDTELAQSLLNINADTFAALLDEAEVHANELVQQLQVDTTSETDWAHRIWLRQQIKVVTAGFSACSNWSDFLSLHQLVSRCLFSQPPVVILQHDEGGPLLRLDTDEFAINLTSVTSKIAAAARGNRTFTIREAADLAVVDRLLLRELDCDDAFAVPVPNTQQPALLIIAADEDNDMDSAAELYAEALAEPIRRIAGGAVAENEADQAQLERFRAEEHKRLREIVHEANNPLSIVHNYLHILELRLQHEPEAVEQLELIAAELRRAGEVITRARDIPLNTHVEPAAVGEIAELELATWAARLAELHSGIAAEAGIPLNTNLPSSTVEISTEPDKLTQIISNLVKNAIEACKPGDEVLLGIRGGVVRDGRVGAEIFIEDTGPGLTQDVLHNLAGAKVSSKGGEHQGIGLQVAFRLATELDGAIDVRSEMGQGTTFSLFLPQNPAR